MDKNRQNNCFDFIEFPAGNVESLKQAKNFYKDVFGWSYKGWGSDYFDTQSSGLSSGINADPSHRPNYPLAVIYAIDLDS
jgi:uncharacterized protein